MTTPMMWLLLTYLAIGGWFGTRTAQHMRLMTAGLYAGMFWLIVLVGFGMVGFIEATPGPRKKLR